MNRKLATALALTALALPAAAQTGAAQQPYPSAPPPQYQPPSQDRPPPLFQGQSTPAAFDPEPDRRSLLAIVALDALYGAAAGALVGAGVALIINNDAWGRDLMIGTGAGILVGTAAGLVEASNRGPNRIAMDGLGSPDRDSPGKGVTTVARLGGRF